MKRLFVFTLLILSAAILLDRPTNQVTPDAQDHFIPLPPLQTVLSTEIEKTQVTPMASAPHTRTETPVRKTDPQSGLVIIPGNVVEKDYLLGRYNPSKLEEFTSLPTSMTDGRPHYLRQEAAEKLKEMFAAARKDGIKLKVVSAFRSYNYQKSIFGAKFDGKRKVGGQDLSRLKSTRERVQKILGYSAFPGTSRHHWGTEVDVNSLDSSWFKSGEGKKILTWLTAHAAEFGFHRPYTEGRKTGHSPEEWHWSYAPIAIPLLGRYNKMIEERDLSGSQGGNHAGDLKIIEYYVNGINPELIP